MSFHRDLKDRDLHAPSNEQVENNSGSPIAKFRAVKFNGFGTAFMQIQLGNGASDSIRGVTQDIISNVIPINTGFITALGILTEVDTSTFIVGDLLYAGPSGVLQTAQNGPPLAEVLVSDAVQGKIYVQIPPIGSDIDEDKRVGVSSNDSTPAYLIEKVSAGAGIVLTELNNGGDEDLEIKIDVSTVAQSAFKTIITSTGTSPVADNPTDTLTLQSSNNSIDIIGDATTDTINIKINQAFLNSGAAMTCHFGLDGDLVSGTYLQAAGGSKTTSNESTIGFPRAVKFIGYFVDSEEGTRINESFLLRIKEKSNLLVNKYTITKPIGSQTQYNYNTAGLFTFSAGERMAVSTDQGTNKAKDPKVTFWFIWDD